MAGEELFGAAVLGPGQARLPGRGSSVPFPTRLRGSGSSSHSAGWGWGKAVAAATSRRKNLR